MPQHTTLQLSNPHPSLIPSISFDTPSLSHEAGVLLLQQIDESLDFSRRFAECLKDSRDLRYVIHSRREQVQQCLFQLALGYPDRNDAAFLRHDPLFKVACQLLPFDSQGLSSQPTLSRFENDIDMLSIGRLLRFFESSYIQSLPPDTSSVLLDIDPTSSPVHGEQERSAYHAFYRCHMYHPLLIFDGHSNQLITALLRPGNVHAARGALPLLSRIIRGIKKRFPNCQIRVRADAGFSVPRLYEGLEKLNSEPGGVEQVAIEPGSVEYEIGIARNQVLLRLTQSVRDKAKQRYEQNHEHIREFTEVRYAAKTWPYERRVIAKAEHHHKGANPRFVVVNRKDSTPEAIYKDYCGRGQCENGIKDCKNALRGDRLSCSKFVANFFRLLLTAGTYRLMYEVRQKIKEKSQEIVNTYSNQLNNEEKTISIRQEMEEKREERTRKRVTRVKQQRKTGISAKQVAQLGKAQFDTLREKLLKTTAWVKQEENQLRLQLTKQESGVALLVELLRLPQMNTS
jgi:hypothetical protein